MKNMIQWYNNYLLVSLSLSLILLGSPSTLKIIIIMKKFPFQYNAKQITSRLFKSWKHPTDTLGQDVWSSPYNSPVAFNTVLECNCCSNSNDRLWGRTIHNPKQQHIVALLSLICLKEIFSLKGKKDNYESYQSVTYNSNLIKESFPVFKFIGFKALAQFFACKKMHQLIINLTIQLLTWLSDVSMNNQGYT